MIVEFHNSYLQNLFESKPVTGKPRYSEDVIIKFKKTVLKLQFAGNVRELRMLKGLNFEALKGKWKGYHSVRVDKQYRLILTVQKDGSISISDILVIEDLSKHY